jgi:hypothetical protein
MLFIFASAGSIVEAAYQFSQTMNEETTKTAQTP